MVQTSDINTFLAFYDTRHDMMGSRCSTGNTAIQQYMNTVDAFQNIKPVSSGADEEESVMIELAKTDPDIFQIESASEVMLPLTSTDQSKQESAFADKICKIRLLSEDKVYRIDFKTALSKIFDMNIAVHQDCVIWYFYDSETLDDPKESNNGQDKLYKLNTLAAFWDEASKDESRSLTTILTTTEKVELHAGEDMFLPFGYSMDIHFTFENGENKIVIKLKMDKETTYHMSLPQLQFSKFKISVANLCTLLAKLKEQKALELDKTLFNSVIGENEALLTLFQDAYSTNTHDRLPLLANIIFNLKRSLDYGQVKMVKLLNESLKQANHDMQLKIVTPDGTLEELKGQMVHALITFDRLCFMKALQQNIPVIFQRRKGDYYEIFVSRGSVEKSTSQKLNTIKLVLQDAVLNVVKRLKTFESSNLINDVISSLTNTAEFKNDMHESAVYAWAHKVAVALLNSLPFILTTKTMDYKTEQEAILARIDSATNLEDVNTIFLHMISVSELLQVMIDSGSTVSKGALNSLAIDTLKASLASLDVIEESDQHVLGDEEAMLDDEPDATSQYSQSSFTSSSIPSSSSPVSHATSLDLEMEDVSSANPTNMKAGAIANDNAHASHVLKACYQAKKALDQILFVLDVYTDLQAKYTKDTHQRMSELFETSYTERMAKIPIVGHVDLKTVEQEMILRTNVHKAQDIMKQVSTFYKGAQYESIESIIPRITFRFIDYIDVLNHEKELNTINRPKRARTIVSYVTGFVNEKRVSKVVDGLKTALNTSDTIVSNLKSSKKIKILDFNKVVKSAKTAVDSVNDARVKIMERNKILAKKHKSVNYDIVTQSIERFFVNLRKTLQAEIQKVKNKSEQGFSAIPTFFTLARSLDEVVPNHDYLDNLKNIMKDDFVNGSRDAVYKSILKYANKVKQGNNPMYVTFIALLNKFRSSVGGNPSTRFKDSFTNYIAGSEIAHTIKPSEVFDSDEQYYQTISETVQQVASDIPEYLSSKEFVNFHDTHDSIVVLETLMTDYIDVVVGAIVQELFAFDTYENEDIDTTIDNEQLVDTLIYVLQQLTSKLLLSTDITAVPAQKRKSTHVQKPNKNLNASCIGVDCQVAIAAGGSISKSFLKGSKSHVARNPRLKQKSSTSTLIKHLDNKIQRLVLQKLMSKQN